MTWRLIHSNIAADEIKECARFKSPEEKADDDDDEQNAIIERAASRGEEKRSTHARPSTMGSSVGGSAGGRRNKTQIAQGSGN